MSRVFDMIDRAAGCMFPKYLAYRDLGSRFQRHTDMELEHILAEMPPQIASFHTERLSRYRNRAYLDVTGQTLLIDLDITETPADTNTALRAGLAAGLVWYGVKLIDDKCDHKMPTELPAYLARVHEQWASADHQSGDLVVGATTRLMHSPAVPEFSWFSAELSSLADAKVHYEHERGPAKIEACKSLGSSAADLTTKTAQWYIPGYPQVSDTFLKSQGMVGNLFDDLKDFRDDRKMGRGYEVKDLPLLGLACVSEFVRHFYHLPTATLRRRNADFIALATMFHVQEILGLKQAS